MKKFYCFADETGQDTKGDLFLVAIVLEESANLEVLEQKLEILEKSTNKRQLKWTKTPYQVKQKYLLGLLEIKEVKEAIYYSVYHQSKEYTPLISLTIAKAIIAQRIDEYTVKIIIDGLTRGEMEKVREELKKLSIRYKKIRGMKDEQNVFIRLADAIAGFLRDFTEKERYTFSIVNRLKKAKIIMEV